MESHLRTANHNKDIPISSNFLCWEGSSKYSKYEVFVSGQMAAAYLYYSGFSLETLIKHSQCDADETEEFHRDGGRRRHYLHLWLTQRSMRGKELRSQRPEGGKDHFGIFRSRGNGHFVLFICNKNQYNLILWHHKKVCSCYLKTFLS